MLQIALLYFVFWITNRVACRFHRRSPIWGLHAVVLAALVSSFCGLLLRIFLAGQQDLPWDAPIWRFEASLWLLALPSVLGAAVGILVISALLLLVARRYAAPLVRWAGQPIWPERYWVHACIAAAYSVGWFLVSAVDGPNAFASIATLAAWSYVGGLVHSERRRRVAVAPYQHDPRPPVLFLRSFGVMREDSECTTSDEVGVGLLSQLLGRRSFEERLAKAVGAEVGPLRALGDPTDALPQLGAVRRYVSSSTWQQTAVQEIASAQCLLVMEGLSPGLRWEWEFISRNVPPQKVFLLTYPRGFPARDEWHDTAAMLQEIGISVPPADPGDLSLFRFKKTWEGEILLAASRSEWHVAEILSRELPLMREHGVLPGSSSLYARHFQAPTLAAEIVMPRAEEVLPQEVRSLTKHKPLTWLAASVLGVFAATVLAFAIIVRLSDSPLVTTNDATLLLLEALESGDWAAASSAVSAGANVNMEAGGRPILFHAIRKGDLSMVGFLLDNGADVSARTPLGRSVLHEAALYGHFDVAKLLIERGADVNARNPRGETPLFYAEDGLLAGPPRTDAHHAIAELLRQHGAVK